MSMPASKLPIRTDYLPFGQPNFSDEEITAVTQVLRSRWIGMGNETVKFEEELAAFLGARHVVTVNSCTSALFLALLVHGIGPGDEIIVPSLTWCATANAALYLGATPVFCDIDPATLCASPESIASKISPKTRGVVVVHYGGLAADIAAIRACVPAHVHIIEDAAHALGSRFPDGTPVGASGNLACFSFYANKNLSTGEGGAIALNDDALASRLKSLRQSGLQADAWKRFTHPQTALLPGLVELGYKMNYTDLQAVIGRVQLRRQQEFHERRLQVARHYVSALGDPALGIGFQSGITDDAHSRHLFVISLPLERLPYTRDEFILELRRRQIGASIHYAPLHAMPLYHPESQPDLPVTEHLSTRNVTLPIGANMSLMDADYVTRHALELLSI